MLIRRIVILVFRYGIHEWFVVAVDDILNREVAPDCFNIINGTLSKDTLHDTRNEVSHDRVCVLAERCSKLSKNLHSFGVDYQR